VKGIPLKSGLPQSGRVRKKFYKKIAIDTGIIPEQLFCFNNYLYLGLEKLSFCENRGNPKKRISRSPITVYQRKFCLVISHCLEGGGDALSSKSHASLHYI
jgi:hypothetical protein